MPDATLRVYLWLPARKIQYERYALLKSTMIMNTAASSLRGWFLGSGAHLSQGHAMLEIELPGQDQRFFGKTTSARLSETEKLWAGTFLTDRTPDRGVQQLKIHASPALFQDRGILDKELEEIESNLVILSRPVPRADGQRALDWVNASNDELADDPLQRPAWGFDRGCTNWVHGAIREAGVFAGPDAAYRRVWVHDDAWRREFDLDGDPVPWAETQQGAYQHELTFLTPHIFRDALKNRGFVRENA